MHRQIRGPLILHLLRCLDLTGRQRVIDISPVTLELAKQNGTAGGVPLDFVEGRAEDLSAYADGSFDRVEQEEPGLPLRMRIATTGDFTAMVESLLLTADPQ